MKKGQRKWLADRNTCYTDKCVENIYKKRISELCDMQVIIGVYWESDCNIFDD
jgi:uncharacterized protein